MSVCLCVHPSIHGVCVKWITVVQGLKLLLPSVCGRNRAEKACARVPVCACGAQVLAAIACTRENIQANTCARP